MKIHANSVYLILGMLSGALLSSLVLEALPSGKMMQDPAKLAPATYKVLLDNEKLRVIDYRLQPGKREPVHSHPFGAFVYFLTEANTKPAGSQSKASEDHKRAGEYLWRDPVTHAGENIGMGEIHALLIEPKGICK